MNKKGDINVVLENHINGYRTIMTNISPSYLPTKQSKIINSPYGIIDIRYIDILDRVELKTVVTHTDKQCGRMIFYRETYDRIRKMFLDKLIFLDCHVVNLTNDDCINCISNNYIIDMVYLYHDDSDNYRDIMQRLKPYNIPVMAFYDYHPQ
jgi:hypothetical protein